ncbi:MAG: hypothetical protein GF331_15200 [Chitinivibrionales bacterium]|nr:hypothetical protein [Chitinivibrionales bacterium]
MSLHRSGVRTYRGPHLEHIAFPMGGIGAGMICLEGSGALSSVSVRHRPDVFHEPWLFAALCVKGLRNGARILEGPVPAWKPMFPRGRTFGGSGNGQGDKLYGLPRLRHASFTSRFPFATVTLSDPSFPLHVGLTGWSPFVPGDSDSASLPVAALEYAFTNTSRRPVDAVFSFHSRNFMDTNEGRSGVQAERRAFRLWQEPTKDKPWLRGACMVSVDADRASVKTSWFRGGWFDTKTMLWRDIARGALLRGTSSPDGAGDQGGSLYAPLRLRAGETVTVVVRLCWYVPQSDLRAGYSGKHTTVTPARQGYRPWYASRFDSVEQVSRHWRREYGRLRRETAAFTDCFYDSSLPGAVVEAIAANLSILKSPTVLRQHEGRLWAWEGCCDCSGCCYGSCTHVWNYAQALPHLFPDLERSLRHTELTENQDRHGHQHFRTRLPIARTTHSFHAAADGQLGGIMKVHRDWRISGDTEWLRSLWPKVRGSLDYCIETWDPRHRGVLEEPHHNTYDIEFWGPDGMCCSIYLGALRAAVLMGQALGEAVGEYERLYECGRQHVEENLFNGEYFEQQVVWKGLNAQDPVTEASKGLNQSYSPEALTLLKREGPKYQYGTGCLADGVLGDWLARACGVGPILNRVKIRRHLAAVYRYNFKHDLSVHVNPQRPAYALGDEAGLVLCTWPRGGALSLPFPYATEVWTGIEYQVASHLAMLGEADKALDIVKAARARYDGRMRNPYDEIECGHWYARALASYGLLQGLTGIRYDAVERTLYVDGRLQGPVRCFLSTASGFGTVVVRGGSAHIEVVRGSIPVEGVVFAGRRTRTKQSRGRPRR